MVGMERDLGGSREREWVLGWEGGSSSEKERDKERREHLPPEAIILVEYSQDVSLLERQSNILRWDE